VTISKTLSILENTHNSHRPSPIEKNKLVPIPQTYKKIWKKKKKIENKLPLKKQGFYSNKENLELKTNLKTNTQNLNYSILIGEHHVKYPKPNHVKLINLTPH
jgi:hypothetical protein